MAYYNKQEILNYVGDSITKLESKGLKPLNPSEEVVKRLNDEEDMVGFFWIEYIEDGDCEKIKMEGKSWYRISGDLYTDDRFAIDLYQAMIAGLTVTDIIKKREIDKELAKQGIVDIETLEKTVKENIKKNGD